MSQTKIRFTIGNIELVSQLIEGVFPDYRRVIPNNNPKVFEINREELKAGLQQASVLSTDSFKGVRWSLDKNGLVIASTNAEMEEVSVKLNIVYDGEPLDIGFNVNYLLDALNVLKVENVRFSLGGPLSSALVSIPDSEKFKYVVMPMSI